MSGPHHQLIDLTSSAQQATERMRISQSPPPSPYLSRQRSGDRDVEMIDENRPFRQRQMIDVEHQLPTPASSQRLDHGTRSDVRSRDEYMSSPRTQLHDDRRPVRHDYPAQLSYAQNSARVASNAGIPAYGQVVYEPVDDRQLLSRPVRYIPEQPPPPYNGQRQQQYYVLEPQEIRHTQPQHLYNDSAAPIDGAQYSADPR